MFNALLFVLSGVLIAGSARYCKHLGQSALTTWITILSLLANIFVLKQIDLFGLNATASDVFAIGSLLCLNLLQEQYGRHAAQQAIWISFGSLLFFTVFSQIHLYYEPSLYDSSQESYVTLFSPAPRIIVASLITFLLVEQLDMRLYAFLRRKYPHRSLLLMNALSLSLSQFLDTVLFSMLGLYGIVSAITEIILVSYSIKLLAIANTLPWSLMNKRLFLR